MFRLKRFRSLSQDAASSKRRSCLLVAALVLLSASTVFAGPPDPPFGTNRCRSSILAAGTAPDVDDYVAPLLAGEKLSVAVRADGASTLLPRLALVGPDGVEVSPSPAVVVGAGKSAAIRSFAVPATGRWTVRISGASGTEGAYVAAFKIAPAPAPRLRASVVAGSAVVQFQGLDGARLDVLVTWREPAARVRIASVANPLGLGVPVNATFGNSTASARHVTLRGGDGTYVLRLADTGASADCVVSLRVVPQGRPTKTLVLSPGEPWVEVPATPILGIAGTPFTMNARNLSAGDPPRVTFGDVPGLAQVAADGKTLTLIPPTGIVGGTTVAVAVIARDGQYFVAPDCFHYVAAPSIDDLVDLGGLSVRHGPAAGGNTLVLRGAAFSAGQTIRFGAAAAAGVVVQSPTRVQVVVPVSAKGVVFVYVDDAFGRTAQSVFTYTFD
jgi:hypothetical protein